jgi:hypothetical protein
MRPATKAAMEMRRIRAKAGMCLLLLAGCDAGPGSPHSSATAKLPPVETVADPAGQNLAAAGAPPGSPAGSAGRSQYISIEPGACRLLEENVAEGGYWRRRCDGAAGYALETSESDLRQDIVVIAPDGRRSELNLSSVVANGAFNSLGSVAEWRGLTPGKPRALIVRLRVPGDAAVGRSGRSDLVIARLAAPACVVALVPRGPGQNEKARAIADGKLPACQSGP